MRTILPVPDREVVRRAYDLWSHFYDVVAGPWEQGARTAALESILARGERFLDVGIGPGRWFAAIAARSPTGSLVCGLDLSAGMVRRAHRQLRRERPGRARIVEADALTLPFADGTFDVVTSSYMLDLLPMEAIAVALCEFRRVLAPSGRVVLVNLTKVPGSAVNWYERLYRVLPRTAQAYVLGGCRPVRLAHIVRAAGFGAARRLVVRDVLPSEVLVARRERESCDYGADSDSEMASASALSRGPDRQ